MSLCQKKLSQDKLKWMRDSGKDNLVIRNFKVVSRPNLAF